MSVTGRAGPSRLLTVAESGAVGYPTGGAMRRWTRLVPRARGRGGSIVLDAGTTTARLAGLLQAR